MPVELQLGQQVAGGDAQERAGREAQCVAQQRRFGDARPGRRQAISRHAQGDHRRVERVDQCRRRVVDEPADISVRIVSESNGLCSTIAKNVLTPAQAASGS